MSGQKPYRAIMLIDDNEIDNLINQKIIEASNICDYIFTHTGGKSAIEFLKNIEKIAPLTGNQGLPELIFLDIDKLIPCGLILNEIITNSIKYAFNEGQQGIISIWASLKNGICQLQLKDNGKGLPADFNPQKSKSLGLRLVDGLVKQIKGSWQVHTQEGTSFSIQFEPMLKVA